MDLILDETQGEGEADGEGKKRSGDGWEHVGIELSLVNRKTG
jgi:hypothetical protein